MYNHKTGASADFPESTAKVALKNGWIEVAEAKAPPIGVKSKAKLKADAEAGIKLKADARVVDKAEERMSEKWEAKDKAHAEAVSSQIEKLQARVEAETITQDELGSATTSHPKDLNDINSILS